jgi:hypothetical protein
MNEQEKAKYYDWLISQHTSAENEIKRIPKISIEEQSRDATSMNEYTPDNKRKVDMILGRMNKIQEEIRQLF